MQTYFLLLLFAIRYGLCNPRAYEDLQKLLSQNNTIKWLRDMEIHNNTSPYCNLCCVNITTQTLGKQCGSHTLCKFEENKIGPSCKGYINVFFTLSEKQALLDVHNTLRNKVALGLENRGNPGPQPMAANMRELQWDDELALIADRWAAQCMFTHDRCRDTERYPVGQNLARGNLATNNELSLIEQWYEEVTAFNSNEILNFQMSDKSLHESGSFTQMIWADTYQIGCARAIFQQNYNSKIIYKEHVVCNYGPTGNIPNQPVYKIGLPCSSCPEGTDCSLDYSGLCGISANFAEVRKSKNSSISRKISIVLLIIIYLFYSVYLYITF